MRANLVTYRLASARRVSNDLFAGAFAAGVFVLDALVMGQGLLALVVLLAVLTWLLPKAMLYRLAGRRGHRLALGHVLLLALTAVAIMLTINGNNALARQRAAAVVAALDAYRDVTGRYPASLDELVPGYLAVIPRAKLSLTYNRYIYRAGDGLPELAYTDVPPLGRRHFDFTSRRWRAD